MANTLRLLILSVTQFLMQLHRAEHLPVHTVGLHYTASWLHSHSEQLDLVKGHHDCTIVRSTRSRPWPDSQSSHTIGVATSLQVSLKKKLCCREP